MDLELSEEQKLLQKSVREFAESEVRPLAKELDETGHFPRELFKKAAELGLTGVAFPEDQGGAGFDHIAYTIVIEEISRCCASTGVILSVQNSLAMHRCQLRHVDFGCQLVLTTGDRKDDRGLPGDRAS